MVVVVVQPRYMHLITLSRKVAYLLIGMKDVFQANNHVVCSGTNQAHSLSVDARAKMDSSDAVVRV